jgi:hypothetical protein
VFGSDAGDQCLGSVAAGHTEQVGPIGHRGSSQFDDVNLFGTLQ